MKVTQTRNILHNPVIPKPKLLSKTQHPRKQLERVHHRYSILTDLAHNDVLIQYAQPNRFWDTYNSQSLSYAKKISILRPILLQFYTSRSDEFSTLQEYLTTKDPEDTDWFSSGIRYNLLRPMPSHLPRRTYDPTEYRLPNYLYPRRVLTTPDSQLRKLPHGDQILQYTPRHINYWIANLNKFRSLPKNEHNLRATQKHIEKIESMILSKPEDLNTPTLPKYHGSIKTFHGILYW